MKKPQCPAPIQRSMSRPPPAPITLEMTNERPTVPRVPNARIVSFSLIDYFPFAPALAGAFAGGFPSAPVRQAVWMTNRGSFGGGGRVGGGGGAGGSPVPASAA